MTALPPGSEDGDLSQAPAVLRLLRPAPPPALWAAARDPRQWHIHWPRLVGTLVMVALLPGCGLLLILRALAVDSLWIFYVGLVVIVMWLISTVAVGVFQVWRDVRRSMHDVMGIVIANSERELQMHRSLRTLPTRAVEVAAAQLSEHLEFFEQRFSLLFGAVRQGGVLAVMLSLVAGYIGIAEKIGTLKGVASGLLGAAIGVLLAVFLIDETMVGLRVRVAVLRRFLKLRAEDEAASTSPPS